MLTLPVLRCPTVALCLGRNSLLIRIAENSCAFREPTALAAGLHVSPDSLESAGISADLYHAARNFDDDSGSSI